MLKQGVSEGRAASAAFCSFLCEEPHVETWGVPVDEKRGMFPLMVTDPHAEARGPALTPRSGPSRSA